MKIILSRKGFDSQYGGYPSPIFPEDDRLISLPIPSQNDNIRYNDLKIDSDLTYYEVMKCLKEKIKYKDTWHDLTKDTKCHLDPDIYRDIRKRPKYWKPIFGQINAAQSHLENEGVKKGDIFLFFGTFRKTEYIKGDLLRFVREEPPIHIISGYLQIGEKCPLSKIQKETPDWMAPGWMNYHPHIASNKLRESGNNTIYIARDTLSFNPNLPGAGSFNYREDLVLTKEEESKSRWDLPSFFKEVKISYHSPKSWVNERYFQSRARGQEFVICSNGKIEKWVKDLIINSL